MEDFVMNNNSDAAVAALLTGFGAVFYIFMLLIGIVAAIILVVSLFKMFIKAGEPGWAAIVPIYNIWVLCKIAFNNNVLWFILFLIPATSGIAGLVSYFALAKAYGKGAGFGVLMIFFPYIAFPILGFSSAEYTGDKI